MTYGVIDVERRRDDVRARRALPADPRARPTQPAGMRKARLLAPDGLVVGLQIDDGTMFESLLQEQTITLAPGDLVVLVHRRHLARR